MATVTDEVATMRSPGRIPRRLVWGAIIVLPTAVTLGFLAMGNPRENWQIVQPIPLTETVIEGTVTCNGQDVTSGSVVVWNADGPANYALIQPDGKYRIEHAPLGRVRLTVSSRTYPPDRLLPKNGDPWPPGLQPSSDTPREYEPQEHWGYERPEPLPKPTAQMRKLLDDINTKYGTPLGPDGFFITVEPGSTTHFDFKLTAP